MRRRWRSLRVRLATLGFLAIYTPALLLFGVVLATDIEVTSTVRDGGAPEVVLAHPAPTEAVYRQGMQRSRAAAERLQRTIAELLIDARGRARSITRSPADLVRVVDDLVGDARLLAAAKGVRVVVEAPDPVVCPVEESTVRRAVANVLDNAVRHAPPESAIEVHVGPSGPMAAITVTDHGPGIPADQHQRVFERFWRGDARPGHGLGLPIARQIAEAHGGSLTVTSPGPSGDGAVFRLTLRLGEARLG